MSVDVSWVSVRASPLLRFPGKKRRILSHNRPEITEKLLRCHIWDAFLEHPRDRTLFDDLPDRPNTASDSP